MIPGSSSVSVSSTPKHVNFFCEYAQLLRKRDAKINLHLGGYSYFFFSGLSKLPDWRGTLLRGIDEQGVMQIKRHYKQGKSIHWSAMSSASPVRSSLVNDYGEFLACIRVWVSYFPLLKIVPGSTRILD